MSDVAAVRLAVLAQQAGWARRQNVLCENGYVDAIDSNLRAPLSSEARRAFSRGSGGELVDVGSRPGKMRALHSSSALVVNVFDYWTSRDVRPVVHALGITGPQWVGATIEFEAQLPTGLGGIPPNLDLLVRSATGELIGVESKFTEWMREKTKHTIQARYFEGDTSRWSTAGLPRCHAMAAAITAVPTSYRFLDVPQLLKHVLGLRRAVSQTGSPFRLVYLYFDASGEIGDIHRSEIDSFANAFGEEIGFLALSYQEFIATLEQAEPSEDAYSSYLRSRYLSAVASHG